MSDAPNVPDYSMWLVPDYSIVPDYSMWPGVSLPRPGMEAVIRCRECRLWMCVEEANEWRVQVRFLDGRLEAHYYHSDGCP